MTLPLVGIPCCVKTLGGHPFHVVGDKYVRAVAESAGALAMPIPALGPWYDIQDLVGRLDGVLLPGSPSNVEPHHYAATSCQACAPHDPARDATSLPLIRAAVAAGIPILGICRGIQELNVALGGTLHPRVHELPGRLDHRSEEDRPLEEQYGPRHPVRLTPDGALARLFGKTEIMVNSLHGQGIDRLAPGLAVEAVAPDGQIEAVRIVKSPTFAIAVQWHPEWRYRDNPDSTALIDAFGDAVHRRAGRRTLLRAAE